MKADRLPLSRLSELKPGQQGKFFAMLADKVKGATRDGKTYYVCRFRDAQRTATYMVWADGKWIKECETEWVTGGFFKIQAIFTEHDKYGPQIEIERIRLVEKRDEAEGFNLSEFVEQSRFDTAEMHRELLDLIQRHVTTPALQTLCVNLLERHRDTLIMLPASLRNYYPYRGGWLEHTLSVTKKALRLAHDYREHFAELKPTINVELVVVGAALHEIGRVREFQLPELPTEPVMLTTDGRFLGHQLLARDLVRAEAATIPEFDPLLLTMVEHLLLAHLTLPEWGSHRLPLIPEVLILHHADDLDAKLEMYARCLTKDTAEGEFTERDPVLGKQLFKGRVV